MKHFHPEVPHGSYCYGRQQCPHFTIKHVSGTQNPKVELPWCNLLQRGSVPGSAGSLTEAEAAELTAVWGTQTLEDCDGKQLICRDTPQLWDLFLLFDSCKECGIASYDREQHYRYRKGLHSWRRRSNPSYPNYTVVLYVSGKVLGSSELSEFTLTTTVEKNITPTQQTRKILRFLNRIPLHLSNSLQLHDGVFLGLDLSNKYQYSMGGVTTAPKPHTPQYSHNIPISNFSQVNLVAVSYQIVRALT